MRAFDPHIPILFFSGAAYEADKKKGIEAGADDYVIKPNISELVRSIKQFMARDVQQPVGRRIRTWAEVLPVRPSGITSEVFREAVALRAPSHGRLVELEESSRCGRLVGQRDNVLAGGVGLG
jgi:DNA-binding response OmpR family regulator